MLAISKENADFICNVIREEMEGSTKGFNHALEENKGLKEKADALGVLIGDSSDKDYLELKQKLDNAYNECIARNKKRYDEEMAKYTKCIEILTCADESQ